MPLLCKFVFFGILVSITVLLLLKNIVFVSFQILGFQQPVHFICHYLHWLPCGRIIIICVFGFLLWMYAVWETRYSLAKIKLFSLFFACFVGENVFRVTIVAPNLLDPLAEQTAIIGELEKYTSYNITVLCFTDPGDGPSSAPILVQTDEDGPYFLS